MILEIRLSNFFSIKDEASLDLRAANTQTKQAKRVANNLFSTPSGKDKLLKILCIYGANASGKSNLIKAIRSCCGMILNSHNHNENTIFNYRKFKFAGCEHKPSTFYIHFIDNGIEYQYSFALAQDVVLAESMYYFPNGRKAKVFIRSTDKNNKVQYSFGKAIKKPLSVVENTSTKTLFISRASQLGRELPQQIFRYFNTKFLLGYLDINLKENFVKYKSKILSVLESCDSDIVDIEISNRFEEVKGYKNDFNSMSIIEEKFLEQKLRIWSYHRVNPKVAFDFFNEESAGTQKLFHILLRIIDVIENDKILLIDEIEDSLHPHLVEHIFDMFKEGSKAQLICSTHCTNLLDLQEIRKEQIVFVSKNDKGESEVYSAYDFKDFRDNMDLEKAYNYGRFGAVPYLGLAS